MINSGLRENEFDQSSSYDGQKKTRMLLGTYDIPLSEIDEFPDHPFIVTMDEDMQLLVDSIMQSGVLTPIIVRVKENGRYELISGHRRKKACELSGMETIRANVMEMTDDEAMIAMIQSNCQRSKILPSEKAHAYKMMMDAMKRQGKRTDLTSSPTGTKSRTSEEISNVAGDSRAQIDRYLRLNELIPELLGMVDAGRISLRPAYELTFLNKEEQRILYDAIEYSEATPSHAQALRMKAYSKSGSLKMAMIREIMSEKKPNQRDQTNSQLRDVMRFVPDTIPVDRASEYIIKALEMYNRYLETERKKKTRSSRNER